MFQDWGATFQTADGYTRHPSKAVPVAYKVSDDLPPVGINEHWRRAYLDVTCVEVRV